MYTRHPEAFKPQQHLIKFFINISNITLGLLLQDAVVYLCIFMLIPEY